MAEQAGTARPVQILRTKDEHSFEVVKDELGRILLADHVKDKPIVVVSIAGAFRMGKSFLMDFFLRYMRSGCHRDWLGDPNTPLEGFSWRGGSELDTTGIVLWDEIFLVTTTEGQQLAVLFMDTQGSFDCESTVKDGATIFALSTMTSSVLVYNLSQNIQEDDLQHLQFCTDYGMLAQQCTRETPFQKLLFLVRDWSYLCDASYGSEGGRSILDRRLQTSDSQHQELKQLRQHIRSCFTEIDCFLMPHPGSTVTTVQTFDGRLTHIEDSFKKCLKDLVPSLLAPDNLLVKEINGQKVSYQDWMNYFLAYVNAFKEGKLPEPRSLLEVTAEAQNLAAVATAKEEYTTGMEKICGGSQPYVNHLELLEHHLRMREAAKESFSAKHKMGGEKFAQPYLEKLTQEIDEMFEGFSKHNENKNRGAAIGTLATLFKLWLVFYITSSFSIFVGLYAFANLCNLLMSLSVMSLVLWVYARYVGTMTEVASHIDTAADVVWSSLLKVMLLCKTGTAERVPRLQTPGSG